MNINKKKLGIIGAISIISVIIDIGTLYLHK